MNVKIAIFCAGISKKNRKMFEISEFNSESGQIRTAIQVQEILGHIFCLVAKPILPIQVFIQQYQVWL